MSHEKDEEGKSFADLFESYSQGMNENIRVGDRIRGKIISIGQENVYVDTGTKMDGVVEKPELLDEKGELPFRSGDVLDLYVISLKGDEVRLSRALSGRADLALLDVFEKSVPVEGKVKGQCKGGFHVEVFHHRAFCPISQMDTRFVENPEDYVGKTFNFLITRLEENGRNIVVSRRDLLLKEQEKERKAFLEKVQIGAVLEGRVKKVMPYGVFVELCPGVEGMAHITELSWSRVESPGEILKADDPVEVKVIGIEKGGSSDEVRIALSLKQLIDDPWSKIGEELAIGDKVRGKVTRCADFGAFVEISTGIEGLIHVSEMAGRKRGARPEETAPPGEIVYVTVKEIDTRRRRISLSMRDTEADPWFGASEKYQTGQVVKGTLEKKEKFGFFISLEPGITGLLPRGKISASHRGAQIEKLGLGEAISVLIEEIDAEKRRMSLAPADPEDEGEWKAFVKDKGKPVGSLGEKLKEALLSKK